MSFTDFLPAPVFTSHETKNIFHPAHDAPLYPTAHKLNQTSVPPYGARSHWVPRSIQDFEDGGAFPEIHIPQYPLNMGKKDGTELISDSVVALTVDDRGKTKFDAIVTQGRRNGVVVHASHYATKEKVFTEDELMRPDDGDVKKNIDDTRQLLEKKLQKKIKNTYGSTGVKNNEGAKYIRYTPANTNPNFNSGAESRIIRMVDMPQDPFEPPKFKHKKLPPGPGSPPVPVLHSPTKQLTKDERDAWKIPPCISNWKNNKGYIIPLDKRLAADGRGLQEHVISDGFAPLSEALYLAEIAARKEVSQRATLRKKIALAEQQAKEEELKKKAELARERRADIQKKAQDSETKDEKSERIKREKIREIRRLERERDARLANAGKNTKKTRVTRDHIRDISEKIALGHQVGSSTETLFDQRLFNQSEGISSGFGDDEDYDVYDKRLFGSERETALYKAPNEDDEMYGEKVNPDKIANTKRFVPDKDFEGVDRSTKTAGPRTEPVQYVKDRKDTGDEENDDIYGFNEFFSEAKGKAKPKQQNLGMMHAVAGSGVGGGEGRGRSIGSIGFEKASDSTSSVSKIYAKREENREERREEKRDDRREVKRDERSPDRRSRRDRSRDRNSNRDKDSRNNRDRRRDRSSSREHKRSRRD
jgi:SNW domain-containing protein 1